MNFPAGTILDSHGQPVASADFSSLYEGASAGDRMGDWGFSAAGPNASLTSLTAIRKRGRHLDRNNPVANKGIDSFVSNLVGTDISPSWNLDNDEQREELSQLWDDSQLEADFYGVSDFYGSQDIACRSMIRDGEILGRFHDVDPAEGLVVPLQLQLLEADHLDSAYNDISPEGNEIRYAIEWKNGRRHKYWLYKDHPGESFLTGSDLTRVPVDAADMLHMYRVTRAGQARGISWLAPIIVKLHDIDIYDDAEVMRKKAAALFGGFIYKDKAIPARAGNPVGGSTVGTVKSGTQKILVGAATFPILTGNDKVSFSESADVGNNYLDFMRTQFRIIASGLGITYEQLTGDLEGVNYTSLRAGLIEFRRLCETIIARTLIFQYNRPYINRWIYTAVLNGCLSTISVSEYLKNKRVFHRVDWHLDGWAFTDPVKDRVAELMDIRNGISSRGEVIARRGNNIDKVDKKNASEMAKAKERGLTYDCYPTQTTKSGVMQKITDKMIIDSTQTE